jgi:hypothetical protein
LKIKVPSFPVISPLRGISRYYFRGKYEKGDAKISATTKEKGQNRRDKQKMIGK